MELRTEEFFAFMKERESIRQKRLKGQKWPWTDDPILQTYKFTNVKREHDRTTQYFKTNFYDTFGQKATKTVCLLNAATFRYFGTMEFAEAVGWSNTYDPDRLIRIASDRLTSGLKVFTGAYIITNQGLKRPKQEVVAEIFLGGLWAKASEIVKLIEAKASWRIAAYEMFKVPGFGGTGFMTKEVLLDTLFTKIWNGKDPVDFDEWTPAGPGAMRGASRVAGLPPETKMRDQEIQDVMLQLFSARAEYWPSSYPKLNLTDIQFQLCEFDKYERAKNKTGVPRAMYRVRLEDR